MRKSMRKRVSKIATAVALSAVLTLSNVGAAFGNLTDNCSKVEAAAIDSSDFLKADGKVLRNNSGNGDVVYLRGTNAGGYLLQEFWMCLTSNSTNVSCEMDIYNKLTERFGEDKMRELINYYQDQYWTTTDFDNCADMGINCIRLPIWYLNLEDSNGNDVQAGWERIDWFVEQAGQRGIYVILDMHGAPGSQNGSDHSGVDGGDAKQAASQFFWGSSASANQERYYKLWEKLAARYKNNPTVAGYDLLNEPFCTYRYNSGISDSDLHNLLWGIYDNAYKRIRAIDSNHVIIMEATWNPVDLPNPTTYGWTNVMYEYHNYLYDDYDNAAGNQISNMQSKINAINSANYNVPSYMGEFCYFNNTSAWDQGLKLLNDAGLNWTTWTYKTVSSYGNWGLYHHPSDNKVNIETDSFDTIKSKWTNVKTSEANTGLINVAKNYFPGTVKHDNYVTLSDGEYYFTAVANGKIVSTTGTEVTTSTPQMVATKDSYAGAWETIHIVNNSDGTVSFKSGATDKYICAVIDEDGNNLVARSDSIGDWEKFRLVKVTDTQYAIKATGSNGKYVKADINEGSGNVLKADSESIQAWECFLINPVGQSGDGGNNGNTGNTGDNGNTESGSIMDGVTVPTDGLGNFKVVGYVPNWYGTGYLDNIDYSQVTNLIYAFAIPTADGNIMALNDGGFMTTLVDKAHSNGVKVSIAIGGWSYNDTPLESTFAAATNTDAKCKTLADSMLAVVDQYGLDGIDVDWEYPRENTSWQFERLIQYLREGLDQRGSGKILTAAVAGTTTTGYSSTALSKLDWLNIMAYDGDAGAGHSPYSYAVSSTNAWKNVGVSKEKLVVGVPFYERPNWASYATIVSADRNNAYNDSAIINGTTVYYNGLDTIAEKTKFACENAGGVMIWEMSQDYTADKSLSLLNKIYTTAKENLGTTQSTSPVMSVLSADQKVTLTTDKAFNKNGSFQAAANGSYADYFIDVAEPGTYTITYSVKGQGNGTGYTSAIDVYTGEPGTRNISDTAANTITIPGLWTTDTVTITKSITLEAGEQVIRVASNADGYTLSQVTIEKPKGNDVNVSVGGNVDISAGAFSDSVGNYVVNNGILEYTVAGNVFDYDVKVQNAGAYMVTINYALLDADNVKFKLEAIGEGKILELGTIDASATGAWNTYKDTEGLNVNLPEGNYTLRMTLVGDGVNVEGIHMVYTEAKSVSWTEEKGEQDGTTEGETKSEGSQSTETKTTEEGTGSEGTQDKSTENGGNTTESGSTQGQSTETSGNTTESGSTQGQGTEKTATERTTQSGVVGMEQGDCFSKGKLTYRILSVDNNAYTVEVVKPLKKTYTSITIPAAVSHEGLHFKVTSVAKNAFKNNKKLSQVTMKNNMKVIGENAFSGCKKLKNVTFGTSVTEIKSKAFYNCTQLKKVIFKGTVLEKVGTKAFVKTNASLVIKVKNKKTGTAYQKLLKKKIPATAVIKS